jgi:hypothetical protein
VLAIILKANDAFTSAIKTHRCWQKFQRPTMPSHSPLKLVGVGKISKANDASHPPLKHVDVGKNFGRPTMLSHTF